MVENPGMDYARITYGTHSVARWKPDMENYAHMAMICVAIFAADFNMSDNGVITLSAKYHVP